MRHYHSIDAFPDTICACFFVQGAQTDDIDAWYHGIGALINRAGATILRIGKCGASAGA
ncbi:MAG: hypothetical protein LBU25_00985 [Treponema sp.]|nr:hypothetical protein [Treponema sp.]